MSNNETIACSLCGKLSEATFNSVPDAGLVLEPYMWGGYSEFVDSLGIEMQLSEEYDTQEVEQAKQFFTKNKRFLCHDCVAHLFRWLKIEPDPSHHQFLTPGVRCCEWGYDPISQ